MALRNMSTIYLFNSQHEVLLMKRSEKKQFAPGIWAGIGGHFEKEELNSPEQCLIRELYEETGIKREDIVDFSLKYITIRKKGDEIRQQYIFFAKILDDNQPIKECDEGVMKWIEIDKLFDRELSYTNECCLHHYFKTGKVAERIYVCSIGVKNDYPTACFSELDEFN